MVRKINKLPPCATVQAAYRYARKESKPFGLWYNFGYGHWYFDRVNSHVRRKQFCAMIAAVLPDGNVAIMEASRPYTRLN